MRTSIKNICNYLNNCNLGLAFNMRATTTVTSNQDATTSEFGIIEFDPMDQDNFPTNEQIAMRIIQFLSRDKELDCQADNVGWIWTIYQTKKGHLGGDIYQYITLTITDLTLHITITDPAL